MAGVLVGLMLFFIFVSMRMSTPNMELLYSDLSNTDSASIAGALEEAGVEYNVHEDGSRIMVSGDEVGRARLLLAKEGLPNGGSMGYEIFDKKSGFGTTNFVQNINQVRALEGELSRTISSMEAVKSARIHLVLPQRELFSRENRKSSASVFLGLHNGAFLDREQVLSIQSLVSSAVPQLTPDNVSVVDSNGNLLARNDEQGLMGGKSDEMKINHEARMVEAIEDIVGRIVGYGKVRANVTADLSFDHVVINEELYDPETQVVRSATAIEDSSMERAAPSGDVSVRNNLPGIAGDLLVEPKPSNEASRIEETTNYEISKTIRNVVREIGEVQKLSVAVLVDGTYSTDEEGTKTYVPRTEEELDKIKDLVKSAVGYDEARGDSIEVINMQFVEIDAGESAIIEDKLFGFEKSDLLDAAEIIVVAIMVILVILLVLQPMLARILSPEQALDSDLEADLLSGQMKPALEGPESSAEDFVPPDADEEDSLVDMNAVEGKVKASSVKKVEDIVSNYPKETVSVIRGWMTQEN
jgi:flagellar M-ring protein FliF